MRSGRRGRRTQRVGRFRDTASSSADVNTQVATLARKAIEARTLPVVLAGSRNAALGVLAGCPYA
jgi:hypothetical protein